MYIYDNELNNCGSFEVPSSLTLRGNALDMSFMGILNLIRNNGKGYVNSESDETSSKSSCIVNDHYEKNGGNLRKSKDRSTSNFETNTISLSVLINVSKLNGDLYLSTMDGSVSTTRLVGTTAYF